LVYINNGAIGTSIVQIIDEQGKRKKLPPIIRFVTNGD
jgi:hypothetical protein